MSNLYRYTIVYSHGDGASNTMTRDLASDKEAVDFARAFVRDGFRNETEATVALRDGRKYMCVNKHGDSDACYDGQMVGDEAPVPVGA